MKTREALDKLSERARGSKYKIDRRSDGLARLILVGPKRTIPITNFVELQALKKYIAKRLVSGV